MLALFAQGCSTPPRKEAVPEALTSQAEIPGLPGVRYRLTEIDVMAREGLESVERERRHLASIGHRGRCRRRCIWRSRAAGMPAPLARVC